MRIRREFPHTVREIENLWIPMRDGTRLAARMWLPDDADASPVPAIVEYIPYRKDDWTAHEDARRHPFFAGMGYAALRIDLRGTGGSDGVCLGEYLQQEQDDALDALAWIAEQPWCTGRMGMIGYSWGGFSALQVAALRPPGLDAIITVDSTDDRYRGDCHYMGGCLLGSDMLKWATSMQAHLSQPPDPRFVGPGWVDVWRERLESTPLLIADWLSHQRHDDFWRHGSIAEDYSAIQAAVLAIGGWADPYVNTVPRLLERLECPRAGIIGPWEHAIPTPGVPGPQIDVLGACAAWFDRWLKGADNGVDDWPELRLYHQGWTEPSRSIATRPGRWLELDTWSDRKAEVAEWSLRGGGVLDAGFEPDPTEPVIVFQGDPGNGEGAGTWCPNGMPDELPGDQSEDDARSLCFDTRILDAPLDVLGTPVVRLRLACDGPLGLVAVRLTDVAPLGSSLLVSWGLLNLTHRDSHVEPQPIEPGARYDVTVALGACAHQFAPGHRVRLALSPTYWPHAWPSPEPITLSLSLDGTSALELPMLPADARPSDLGELEVAEGLPSREGDGAGRTQEDEQIGPVRRTVHRTWSRRSLPHDATLDERASDTWLLTMDGSGDASVECTRAMEMERPGWSWGAYVTSELGATPEAFFGVVTVHAAEGDGDSRREVFRSSREFWIPRDLV